MVPHLIRIAVFPVKSLPGVCRQEAALARGAGLAGDRECAIVDPEGRWVNGKRTPAVHRLRSLDDLPALCAELGLALRVIRDAENGFPDDTNAPGPTVVSTASLRAVGEWFGIADLEELRRRFRANLEIGGVPPFWEDQLVGRHFRIGRVTMYATNICARCVVPSRDSRTGEQPDAAFSKIFAERRRASLPPWSASGQFDHYYRLALNTRVPESEAGKVLRVGDPVEIVPAPAG